MFICNLESDLVAKVSVSDGLEPIRLGLGNFGVHLSREEALDLMSQLEKAVHSLVEVTKTEWAVKK